MKMDSTITVRVTREFRESVTTAADDIGVTVADLVRVALAQITGQLSPVRAAKALTPTETD